MKRIWLATLLIFGMAGIAVGQTTTTSFTTADPDSVAWNAGTYSIQYQNATPGKPYNTSTGQFITTLYTGTLNSSGALSLTLDDVKYISPANGTWIFTICPDVSGGNSNCATASIPVTGTSENVSSQINAVLRAPRPGGGVGAYGYADVEFQSIPGNTYVVSPALTAQRCYAGSWAACGGGGGGSASVKVENVFTGAGTINFQHNLNDEYPLYSCFSLSGATAYTAVPVDANNMAITVSAAATILCAFQATAGLRPDFNFTITPSTETFTPTMSGTQTPTFAIAQSVQAGYTGTAVYSTSGLASGMGSSFSPTSITGTGSSVLSISFPATQAAGLTTITASGTDGALTHTNHLALTISDINANLIDGWNMNEGTGTTFTDDAGAGNNITFSSGIGSWGAVTGFPATPYTFNGTGGGTGTNQTETNFTNTTPFTISCWLRTASSAQQALASTLAGANTTGWEFQIDGDIGLYLVNNYGSGNYIYVIANAALPLNSLVYAVATYDGSDTAAGVRIYVNGVLQPNNTLHDALSASIANSQVVTVGKRPNGSQLFSGTLGYIRIYSGVKTQAQIAAYYTAGPR